jgi:hypothetical protein
MADGVEVGLAATGDLAPTGDLAANGQRDGLVTGDLADDLATGDLATGDVAAGELVGCPALQQAADVADGTTAA